MIELLAGLCVGGVVGWMLGVGPTALAGWRDRQARLRINAEIEQEGSYIRCENPEDLEEVRP